MILYYVVHSYPCLEEEEHEDDELVIWSSGRLDVGAKESAMNAVGEEVEIIGEWASEVGFSFTVLENSRKGWAEHGRSGSESLRQRRLHTLHLLTT